MDFCIYCGKKLESAQTVCPQCEMPVLELKEIDSFSFTPLSTSLASEIENQKTGLFGMGKADLKKMAEAVRNGRVAQAEAIVQKLWSDDRIIDDECGMVESYWYADLSDTDGRPAAQAVRLLDGHHPAVGEEAVLLQYTIKKTAYVVLTKEDMEHFPALVRQIVGLSHAEICKRPVAATEGTLGYRVGRAVAKR